MVIQSKEARPPLLEIAGNVAVMAVAVSCLAVGTIYSSKFTSAYLVLLVFMSAPLFVAPISSLVLRLPLAPFLLPTCLATLAGTGKRFLFSLAVLVHIALEDRKCGCLSLG